MLLQPARMSTRLSSHQIPTERSQGRTLARLLLLLVPWLPAAVLLLTLGMGLRDKGCKGQGKDGRRSDAVLLVAETAAECNCCCCLLLCWR